MNPATSAQNLLTASSSVLIPPPRGGERLSFVPILPQRGGERLILSNPNLILPLRGEDLSQPLPKRRKLGRFHESWGQQPIITPAATPALVPPRPQGSQKQQPIIAPAAPLVQPVALAAPLALLLERPQGSTSIRSPVQLIKDYEKRVRATAQFPPQISDSCIRDSISRFEDHMADAIAATQKICGSCGGFIDQDVFELSKDDPLLQPFSIEPRLPLRLDSCALFENNYQFCRPCHTAIQQRRPPKFSALNAVNVSFCQDYPCVLKDLTLTEECLIARSHPIASILKLRPNGAFNPAAYNRLRGHIVVLPQEPGPLLDILPSPEVKLCEKIKIVWFGDRAPTANDLKPYLEVRKDVVLQALRWLRLYNKLYCQIIVNQELLDSWADSFIPCDLEDSVIHCENDHMEREGYAANIEAENCENDLQQALGDEALDLISSGCVYTDVNSARQLPTLQLLSAMFNLKKDQFERDSPASSNSEAAPRYIEDVPVIRYISNGRSVLMNDWQDEEYFTGSFPTLFPLGTGGHLLKPQDRCIPTSLTAWAKWALGHHSRRYI
jgi:hypothetical protein